MLNVKDITFGYHMAPLFRNVSFQLEAGQLGLLIGPNGAGKSTLMSLITGIREARDGSIVIGDAEVGSLAFKNQLEYLAAESNALYHKLDAIENLQFWSRLRGRQLSEKSALELLEPWGLAHPLICKNFPVERFSTGMKRRLAMARVASSTARVWCLDEPLFGLDQNALAVFRRVLESHLGGGGIALIISHDLIPFQGMSAQEIDIQAFRKERTS